MRRRSAALLAVLLTFIPGTPAPTSRYLYTTLDGPTSIIWSSDGPRQIAQVSHLDGYGIRARLSPDGTQLAYTRVPAMLDEANPGRCEAGALTCHTGEQHLEGGRGELCLIQLSTGFNHRLLADIDVHSTPVWSPEGARLTARRGTTLLSVGLSGEVTAIRPDADVQGVYPFAWRPEGLYYTVIDSGTDVYLNREHLLRASEGIARDFRFAGDRLLYNDTVPGGLRLSGDIATPSGMPAGAEFIGWLP